MEDFTDLIPVSLTKTLNSFNSRLEDKKNRIDLGVTETKFKSSGVENRNLQIKYKVKGTNFYFLVNYVLNADLLGWNFYPLQEMSTKKGQKNLTTISPNLYQEMHNMFDSWTQIINQIDKLPNPLDYFKVDNFVKFYSSELLSEISISEEEEKIPLSSENQDKAQKIINKQLKFLEIQMDKEKNKESDKFYDFTLAQTLLLEIQEDMPRMTVSEVKQKWVISLGVMMKWCADHFLVYMKIDNKTANDISRALGSFIGGVFGIPKIEQ